MGKGLEEIKQGIMEHEDEKAKADDEKYYEGLDDKALLTEHTKHVESIKQQRKAFDDHVGAEEARGITHGFHYIGDDIGDIRAVEVIQRIMKERGIPSEELEFIRGRQ